MDFSQIIEIIKQVDNSKFNEFKMEMENCKISLTKDTETKVQMFGIEEVPTMEKDVLVEAPKEIIEIKEVEVTNVSKPTEILEGNIVTSPIVGIFYSRPAPEKSSFVEVGGSVKQGDVLCIIEAMKIMNELTSQYKGQVLEVLADDGQLVEYGQPLFRIS